MRNISERELLRRQRERAVRDDRRLEDALSALRKIRSWAAFDSERHDLDYEPILDAEHVVALCDRTLKEE